MPNKLDHVAFSVPDVTKAAHDINDVFGIGAVLVFNDPLGLYIAVTDIGLVLSTEIDPKNNPSPVRDTWANGLVTAIEVKVPDRDEVHEKMLARGIDVVFEMYVPGGFREYYYSGDKFYGIPTVVTEYATESIIDAIDENLTDAPEDYGQQLVWVWAPGYEGWSRNGNDYPDLSENIPATSDSRIALCALNLTGQLNAAIKDFDTLFDMPMVTVEDRELGLRIAMGDGGYFLYENLDGSKPSRIASNYGAGILAAVGVRTDDLDGVTERMKGKGIKSVYEMTTPGSFRAVYFDKSFHGLPMLAVSYEGDSMLNAINPGLDRDPSKYESTIRWQ